jgi:hypothetical protein
MRDEYMSVCPKCYNRTYDTEVRDCRRNVAHGPMRLIDRSGLAPEFTPYYHTQERVKVRLEHGAEITGTVGKTTGWKPSYMLMLRWNSLGSSYLLSERDHVIGVRVGRRYVLPWRSTNYRRADGTEPYADVPFHQTAAYMEREGIRNPRRGY